jgi:hypothetical protein
MPAREELIEGEKAEGPGLPGPSGNSREEDQTAAPALVLMPSVVLKRISPKCAFLSSI